MTARSGDVSSTRKHTIMGHVATEERKKVGIPDAGSGRSGLLLVVRAYSAACGNIGGEVCGL